MSAKKRGLGRGLDALLTSAKPKTFDVNQQEVASSQSTAESFKAQQVSELQKLPIEFLRPGKYQPRKDMSEEALSSDISLRG